MRNSCVEHELVFIDIAERLNMGKQQTCPLPHAQKRIPQSANRAAGGEKYSHIGKRNICPQFSAERGIGQKRSGQRVEKGRTGGDGIKAR